MQISSQDIELVDLNDDNWDSGLGAGEYDAIVSTLVLEHLPFVEYKSVLRKCHISSSQGAGS